jgi:endoglucanase
MKYLFAYLLIIFFITGCNPKKTEQKQTNDYSAFAIHRGTNIAHWLSQSESRGEARARFFTKKDILFIDSVGFDHIRLPIDEEQMWDSIGNRHEDAFKLMNACLTWCNEAGLRVVLDLHILRSHHFNNKEKPLWTKPAEQDKFIQLWKDLSAEVNKWPN